MSEALQAAPVEELIIKWLRQEFATRSETATVAVTIPNPRPDRMVRVVRRGGWRTVKGIMDNPLVMIDVWAPTPIAARDLASLTAALYTAMDGEVIDGHPIYRADIIGGPSNQPDTDSLNPRYTITCQLRTRAVAV